MSVSFSFFLIRIQRQSFNKHPFASIVVWTDVLGDVHVNCTTGVFHSNVRILKEGSLLRARKSIRAVYTTAINSYIIIIIFMNDPPYTYTTRAVNQKRFYRPNLQETNVL